MEPSENKYISADDAMPEQGKGRLTGDGAQPSSGTISSDQPTAASIRHVQPAADNQTGIITEQAQLAKATSEGGLTQAPYDFEQKEGSWHTILSDNPFEVLYIDYRQKQLVVPPLIEKNYTVLSVFWQEKLMLMNGAAREKIQSRYGEETVNNAERKLTDAYNKIKTAEGIALYSNEQEHRRILKGTRALAGFIELTLADGELTPNEANILIARGLEQGLSATEVRLHLLKTLQEQQFEKRTKPPQEDEFKNTWRQPWVKDPQQNTVGWLGAQVSSLEELGQVSFANKEEAYDRFKNAIYLPSAVMTITRDDATVKVFEKIIEQTSNEDIRYLKIIYRLNSNLPFRFRGAMYADVKGLLDNAVQDADGFWKADEAFRNGYLQTWIEETDAAMALKQKELPHSTPGFLAFVYQVSSRYPFYFDQQRIDQPADLASLLRENHHRWALATKYISNRYIAVWLTGIGRNDLNDEYNKLLEPVLYADWYTEQDRNMAAVQTLIQTLAENSPVPVIAFDQQAIQLAGVEGTGHASQVFNLLLQTPGYTAVTLQLKNAPAGISLSTQKFSLFDLDNTYKMAVTMNIDVFKLDKDKLYRFAVVAQTPYQVIELPAQVKVSFPTAGFMQKLVMCALASGMFWGAAQMIIRALLGNPYHHSVSRGLLYTAFSLFFLFIFYNIAAAYFKKQLRGIESNAINTGTFKVVLLLAYLGSPVIRQSAGMWFFFWLFPGALLGTYIACKKYNLNKWLSLIPLLVIILLALLVKGDDVADLLKRL